MTVSASDVSRPGNIVLRIKFLGDFELSLGSNERRKSRNLERRPIELASALVPDNEAEEEGDGTDTGTGAKPD